VKTIATQSRVGTYHIQRQKRSRKDSTRGAGTVVLLSLSGIPSCPACSFPPPNQHQQHPHFTHYLTLLHSKKSTLSIRTRESTQEVGSRRGGEREREREEVRKGSSQVEGKATASAEEVN
jgi:hypothetical protein